jgi:hypothetical protein
MNLKHRYTMLTGMHYPEIQKALDNRKIKATDFTCEGMGCKHFARGSELSLNFPYEERDCPYFTPLKDNKEYRKIDSHSNLNLYPKQIQ